MKALRLLLLLLLPTVVQAQTYTNNYGIWGYTTNAGDFNLTITGYTGTNTVVAIPGSIYGLPVIFIGEGAFDTCTGLTSVTIPTSVTIVGDWAFAGCTSLTNVTIGTNVTGIGNYAFNDSGLTGVTIPGSVTSIGFSAFGGCASLTAITVDTNNPSYSSVDGVLFDKSQTAILQYPPGKIGSYTIPNNVTNIEDMAFYGCDGLSSVTISNSVTSIGEAEFEWCTSLTNVIIGTKVTSIGDYAFCDCESLTSLTIPNSVASIGNEAFLYCTSLTHLTIPNSVTSIGEAAFSSCLSLTNVTIPDSVTNIGEAAFIDCTSLTAITVDTNNPSYSSVDGVLFDKSQTTLIQYPSGKSGSSYTIADSVTSIGYGAFHYCTSLTSVTVGNSITNIGDEAFEYCFRLTSVYFQGNAPTSVGSGVFNSFSGYEPATVYYLPGTTGWSSSLGGLPTELWNPQVQTNGSGFGVQTNRFGFNITGTSNLVIVVEACTNLANPSWSPISTNTLVNGASYFSDPEWTNYPSQFYRLTMP
jgi:hypothetical protein